MKLIQRIFNRSTCKYQTTTRWELYSSWNYYLSFDRILIEFYLRFNARSYYSSLSQASGGYELTFIIIPAVQTKLSIISIFNLSGLDVIVKYGGEAWRRRGVFLSPQPQKLALIQKSVLREKYLLLT